MSDSVQERADVDRQLEELELRFPPRPLAEGAEVTRVAPSPTGRPHIGTALQATIDYALARKTGGIFILRIEDTDRTRLVPGAVEEIVEALDWLGLPHDEGPGADGAYGPYVESQRLPDYHVVADWLVEHGHAYLCFCTPERLARVREEQIAAKQPTRYDRHCRWLSAEERRRRLEAGETPVVRLAMPLEGTIVYHDPVRGPIEFDAAEQDDQVLLKSDGYPTYHLAAMTDDHLMRVTTVIRGEEWISSTPKHLVLLRDLGWEPPVIVHTPLLRDAQGRKLSKRSGDTSIGWYRAQGYLPEAFRNFLTRIIWVHPEGKDVYPYEDFIDGITPEELPKTGPIVNHDLLDFIGGEWLRTLDSAELYDATRDWLRWLLEEYTPDGVVFEEPRKGTRVERPVSRDELLAFQHAFERDRAYAERVLSLEPERYRKLGDIVLQTALYFPDLYTPAPIELLTDPTKGDRELAAELLREYLDWYTGDESDEEWERRMDAMWQARELKRAVPFMLLRIAITGSKQTPPLFGVTQVLGAAEVRRRIEAALSRLAD
ncbi:MAG TPA: glutamate--tRNA ligase [Chloroflexota bacterium]